MYKFLNGVLVAGLLAFSVASHAAVVQTIELLPIDGTSLGDVTSPGGVVFDFGGYGKGRVTFSALRNGAAFAPPTLRRNNFVNGATLDNGNQFVSKNSLVFDLLGNDASFVVTVALDTGVLPTDSVFEMFSLDRSGSNAQYFLPGAGMGSVDSNQLLSDGAIPLILGPGGEFSAQSNGISKGRVWNVGGVSTFSGLFRQDRNFGGVGFTIAVQQVPEPGSLVLLLAGLCALVSVRKVAADRKPTFERSGRAHRKG